jgi:D-glycero-beta-D-manno-heptose 1-phosphate adenylyltransferase
MIEKKILSKIKSMEEAMSWRESMRKKGLKVVITNGCFDILHRGHATYLMRAQKQGDLLLLAINSDDSVKVVKGPNRPVNKENDRAFIMACLPFVDAVVVFNTPDCVELLSQLKPDIYVKGGDYSIDTINQDERRLLERIGCKIKILSHFQGYSTTSTIEKINT